jgi:1-acyl-sn-glycerol-3-phosphate acyltransferase
MQTGATLFVANHVSWADITVLGARMDGLFVARADLAKWPLIGALARRAGTLFVARDRPGSAGAQVDALGAQLGAGRDLVLFAEGTTSLGETVLPFRTALFGAAWSAARVQPVLIAYFDAEGRALSVEDRRRIAWIDDDRLLEGVDRVAGSQWTAHVEFLPPLDPRNYAGRKQLADTVRSAIIEAQATLAKRVE